MLGTLAVLARLYSVSLEHHSTLGMLTFEPHLLPFIMLLCKYACHSCLDAVPQPLIVPSVFPGVGGGTRDRKALILAGVAGLVGGALRYAALTGQTRLPKSVDPVLTF